MSSATSYISIFNKLFAGDNFGTFIEANIVYNVTLNIQLGRRVSLLFYSTIYRCQLIFTVTVSNLFMLIFAREKIKNFETWDDARKRTNVITSIFNHAFLIIFRADRLRSPKHSCPTYFSHFRKMYIFYLIRSKAVKFSFPDTSFWRQRKKKRFQLTVIRDYWTRQNDTI